MHVVCVQCPSKSINPLEAWRGLYISTAIAIVLGRPFTLAHLGLRGNGKRRLTAPGGNWEE